jgi:hypothetical protein
VKVSCAKDGTLEIVPDHPDPALGRIALMDALGSEDLDFLTGIINQLGNVVSLGGVVSSGRLNFFLSIVKRIEPRDQVESAWRNCRSRRGSSAGSSVRLPVMPTRNAKSALGGLAWRGPG